MTVHDLNRDQLIELKQNILTQDFDDRGESPSWVELAHADDLISDERVFAEYADYYFTPDDFSSSAGEEQFSLDFGDCTGSREDIVATLREIARAIENGNYGGITNYGTSWGLDKLD